MEILIIICLLLIIVAMQIKDCLLKTKKLNSPDRKQKNDITRSNIMGSSKHRNEKLFRSAENIEVNTEEKIINHALGNSSLNQNITPLPINLVQEESEWSYAQPPAAEEYFSAPVEITELQNFTEFLKADQKSHDRNQMRQTLHKIEGTELFDLLESSIDGAAVKIAQLLDRSLAQSIVSDSKSNKGNDAEDFDISQFI